MDNRSTFIASVVMVAGVSSDLTLAKGVGATIRIDNLLYPGMVVGGDMPLSSGQAGTLVITVLHSVPKNSLLSQGKKVEIMDGFSEKVADAVIDKICDSDDYEAK